MTTVGLAPEIKNLRYLMSLENHVRARASGGGSEESQKNVSPSQDTAVAKTHARIRGRRILGGLFGRDFGRLIPLDGLLNLDEAYAVVPGDREAFVEAEARQVDASRLDHLQDDRSALNLDCVAVHNHLYVVGTFLLGTRVSPLLLWIGSVVGRMGRPHFDFALSSRAGSG